MSLLDEGKANTHLTHLEELVLTQGPKGYEMARSFLLELLEELKGNVDSRVKTSVKWDGAPAIFAGINPENGKFFVGTKSIFNKEPKINYTPKDVQRNHGHAPGLVDKLTKALQYLPPLGIQKILQGDFMFDDEMIKTIDVDGEPHYAFKPNTITYAAPVESKLGQEIAESKFGIVFHTTYKGASFDKLSAKFGANVSKLRRTPNVWFDDARYKDVSGNALMTIGESQQLQKTINMASGSLKKSKEMLNKIKTEKNTLSVGVQLKTYLNSFIRAGTDLPSTAKTAEAFKQHYKTRTQKEIDRVKTEKSKEKYKAIQDNGLKFINGDVVRLNEIGCKKKLPHVGWNEVKLKKGRLINEVEQNTDFYFVHSYCYKHLEDDIVLGTTNYDVDFISIINSNNIYGKQFHPEKSSFSGKKILNNFLKIF